MPSSGSTAGEHHPPRILKSKTLTVLRLRNLGTVWLLMLLQGWKWGSKIPTFKSTISFREAIPTRAR
jgi:hypothetical protein